MLIFAVIILVCDDMSIHFLGGMGQVYFGLFHKAEVCVPVPL